MAAQKVYNTRYSQAVTHPSTNFARPGLTSVIRREPVLSRWYGRRHDKVENERFLSIDTVLRLFLVDFFRLFALEGRC